LGWEGGALTTVSSAGFVDLVALAVCCRRDSC
jgi:hypothetical protein